MGKRNAFVDYNKSVQNKFCFINAFNKLNMKIMIKVYS